MTYPNEGPGSGTPPPIPDQPPQAEYSQQIPPIPQQGIYQAAPNTPAPGGLPLNYQAVPNAPGPQQGYYQQGPGDPQRPPLPERGPSSGKGVPVWGTVLIGVCAALVSAGIVTGIFLSLSFHRNTAVSTVSESEYVGPAKVDPDFRTPSVKSYSGLTPGSYYLEAQQGIPGSFEISVGNKVLKQGEVEDSAWVSIAEGEVLTLTDLTMKAPEGMDPREYPDDYAGPNPPSTSSSTSPEEEQAPTAYQAGVDFTAGEVTFVVLNNEHAGRLTIYDSLDKDPVAVYTFYGSRSFTIQEGQYVVLENLSPPR